DVDDGLIVSRDTNETTTYWDLMGGGAFGIDIDPDIAGKPPADYTRLGKPAAARGMDRIVGGTMRFIHDMVEPGMLHARLVRPPHYNARMRGLDEAVVKRLSDDGLHVVRDGSFLAIAGESEYATVAGAERLAATADWDAGPGLEEEDIFERLLARERISLPVVDGVPRKEPVPPLKAPPAGAAATLNARYCRPYHMHGSIGPSAAMAHYDDDALTIWSHSQGIYLLRAALSDALDIEPDRLTIKHMPGAGCYGHNGADDVALDAALIARALPGRHILAKWTREDEHCWEPYGPGMVMELRASLDEAGKVIDWSHETYSDTHVQRPRAGPNKAGAAKLLAMRFTDPPMDPQPAQPSMGAHAGIHRNLDPLYDFPSKRLVKNLVRDMPLRTSSLRTLGAYANVFAIESFMDELAAEAGIDPVKFRLGYLADERARDVVKAVASKLWAGTEKPAGVGRGIAFARYKNVKTYAAVGIELEVTDAAEVRLLRAVAAADAGQIADADGLSAQLEGGLLQAASWTLYEQVTFDRDGITSRDWDSYPVLRFDNIPEIETVLINRPGAPFLGAGEATAGPTAAAIANAIADATGLRLRRLPFTPDAIRAAAMEEET
ncbi:MAG: molybdopterin cofactor-binding domain-containing protein, partial [Alphaproteobacteria bacterium]